MISVYGAMTHERKARIWQLWRLGSPMIEIARDIVKPPATVYSYLLYHGGMQPRERIRRADCLSFEERETISRSLASRRSICSIAKELGRSPSTVCREVERHGGGNRYRACMAEKAFLKRSKRPADIEDRAIPGHWAGDLIMGSDNSAIATVVERRSRFTVLCKVSNKTALVVVQSLTTQMKKLAQQVLKGLTWDRGQELSAHKTFTMVTDMAVYFLGS